MTEHQIIFSAPMVRAILDGRKTMTRRVLKPQPVPFRLGADGSGPECEVSAVTLQDEKPRIALGRVITAQNATRWAPGDRLWVRETWRTLQKWDDDPPRRLMADIDKIDYAADGFPRNPLWAWGRTRASLHMPRWASRITLLVTDVRVERVRDIRDADAEQEDVEAILVPPDGGSVPHVEGFIALWTHLYGADAWERNDWVSVTKFERIEK